MPCVFIHIATRATPDTWIRAAEAATLGQLTLLLPSQLRGILVVGFACALMAHWVRWGFSLAACALEPAGFGWRTTRAPKLAPPATFRWKYAPLRRKVRAVRFPCFTARFLRLIEQGSVGLTRAPLGAHDELILVSRSVHRLHQSAFNSVGVAPVLPTIGGVVS